MNLKNKITKCNINIQEKNLWWMSVINLAHWTQSVTLVHWSYVANCYSTILHQFQQLGFLAKCEINKSSNKTDAGLLH